MRVLLLAAIPALAAGAAPAFTVVAADGAGCLAVNMSEVAGEDGAGRNVVTSRGCDASDLWDYDGAVVSVSFAEVTACLDVDFGEPSGAGYNVMLWPDCHGGANQSWSWDDDEISVYVNDQAWCLTPDPGERIGDGLNVIAAPCRGGRDQVWSTD